MKFVSNKIFPYGRENTRYRQKTQEVGRFT